MTMQRALDWMVAPFRTGATYRALLYCVAQLALGVVGFAVLIAGWVVTLLLAITPLVVPVLIGFRAAVGGLAQAQAFTARRLLGASAQPSASSQGVGFWSRGFAVLKDESFWRQQAHLLLSWPIALIPLTLLSWAGQTASVPIWYRWVDSHDVFGLFNVDSFAETLPFTAVGLFLLVVLAHLLKPMSSL
jgi:Putative sensor